MRFSGRSASAGGTGNLARRRGGAGNPAAPIVPRRQTFVSPRSVVALPEAWLAEALHRQADGSLRGLCVAARLAHCLRTGAVRCDAAEMAWAPPVDALAAYARRRWGARPGGEGAAHRTLRALAALYLSAAVPGCALSLPLPRTPAGGRRPDLLAATPGGEVAVELGTADADSVRAQLARQGASHVLVLPYAGVREGGLRGYVFRAAARPPLPAPSARGIRAAWDALSAAGGVPVSGGLGRRAAPPAGARSAK